MGKRRLSRELALSALYQSDFGTNAENLAEMVSMRQMPEENQELKDYAEHLVQGVTSHREELDKEIQTNCPNWSLDRMDPIDRNILRLALFEMGSECPDVPVNVAINEAIEIAKKFGTNDSSGFVNGVLDAVAKQTQG